MRSSNDIKQLGEGVDSRNHLISEVHKKYHLIFMSIAIRLGRFEKIKDDVSSFYEKLCNKTTEEIYDLFVGESSTYSLVYSIFGNHLKDRMRKENAKKSIKTSPIHESTTDYNFANEASLDFSTEDLKNAFKEIVSARFSRPDYNKVFDLIAEGYSNQEIADETGLAKANVGTIRHRIKKYLANRAVK